MVDGNLFIPLSPPSSPRMSAFNATSAENEWQIQELKSLDQGSVNSESDMAMLHAEISGHPMEMHRRPMLRAHKSFPYSLKPSGQPLHRLNSSMDEHTSSPSSQRERITISNLEDLESGELPTMTFGGSAPASPVSRLTPPSLSGEKSDEHGDEQDDFQDGDIMSGDGDDEQKPAMSAAELRAQKRKMKRFRLTHNQTRFLMSEFTRQAHPDAAHRERLAREIPGLSPRQVQVWFQNRRAKLKRLTTDDRERMMRSRALPDDFDMAQALHSPFGTTHGMGTPLASPGSYTPSFPEGNMMRSLSIDTLRRMPDGSHISPTGISPAFGGFAFTPPQSATENISPVSTGHENSFGYASAQFDGSPRRSNPFIGTMSMSTSPAYAAHPNIPRLQLHADRVSRTRAESLSSPLRASMTYSNAGNDGGLNAPNDHSHQQMENSHMGGEQSQKPFSSSMMPYGLGYSYSQIPGFQAGATTRVRSLSGSVPRRIELSTHYTPSRSATTPQTATFPNYTSSPLITPQSFQMPHMSAPHHITSFQNSYLRQDVGHGDSYPQVGAVLGEILEGSNQENQESNDSSTQLQQSF
ncbi:uncharacterized protein BDZ99DRAFT_161421 [Mytilinidion resinicola]|uniref:Homeobox domain-containing protein n=1 Tax=Mytilinidion resinicola TaxID=574789 RepID=A0A6A6Y5D4_9PEZI|nr:uncharacterized protein BDZ99DRAFT_161421 [Mytilinidion resinicola]KAF2803733.1 hypothetical protein BDZ99DRAFT_161421 [Mytilinidion resinicola]